jgi:hypothetical protein
MKAPRWIAATVAVALLGGAGAAGVALATHGGLHGLFNARGTVDRLDIRERQTGLRIRAREPLDVAIVGAQLDPGADTDWHEHLARSIVSVAPGGPALKIVEYRHGRCIERTFQPGESFEHPRGPHNFINPDATAPLNFGVCYFVPVGAPLLTPVAPPEACA